MRITRHYQGVEHRDSVWEHEEQIKITIESWNGVKVALIADDIPGVEERRGWIVNPEET